MIPSSPSSLLDFNRTFVISIESSPSPEDILECYKVKSVYLFSIGSVLGEALGFEVAEKFASDLAKRMSVSYIPPNGKFISIYSQEEHFATCTVTLGESPYIEIAEDSCASFEKTAKKAKLTAEEVSLPFEPFFCTSIKEAYRKIS